jgi:glycosyltransferase involved in cell wall biosynthesis
MIRLLTFSTLFPNDVQPAHGIFVERRLQQLLSTGEVSATVVAPVPWFPSRASAFGRYAELAAVPGEETRGAVRVLHPRYPVIPKFEFGMNLAPRLLARWVLPTMERLRSAGETFDLIDAHYYFPDGVAATMIGSRLGVPVVITARGNDVNLFPDWSQPRRMIRRAADAAAATITVCQALKDRLTDLGCDASKIVVLRNGVDASTFSPQEPLRAQAETGLDTRLRWLLSVGQLIPRKGHDLTIRALGDLPGFGLALVGDGELREELESLAVRTGVRERVRFVGRVSPDRLPAFYSVAAASVLASSSEGLANVLLESLACGTPVVATPVDGTPEVITGLPAGVLVGERSAEGIRDALRYLFEHYPDRRAVRSVGQGLGWDATSRGQLALFARILGRPEAVLPGAADEVVDSAARHVMVGADSRMSRA